MNTKPSAFLFAAVSLPKQINRCAKNIVFNFVLEAGARTCRTNQFFICARCSYDERSEGNAFTHRLFFQDAFLWQQSVSGLSGVDHDLICLLAPSLFKYHVSKFFEIQFPAVENKSSPLVLRMISYAKKKRKKKVTSSFSTRMSRKIEFRNTRALFVSFASVLF